VAAAGGDVVVAAEFQDLDGEVPDRGHDLQAAARADPRVVLVVSGVADAMQGLDAPVTADPGRHPAGAAWWTARLVTT
jgi:hypothetical protein